MLFLHHTISIWLCYDPKKLVGHKEKTDAIFHNGGQTSPMVTCEKLSVRKDSLQCYQLANPHWVIFYFKVSSKPQPCYDAMMLWFTDLVFLPLCPSSLASTGQKWRISAECCKVCNMITHPSSTEHPSWCRQQKPLPSASWQVTAQFLHFFKHFLLWSFLSSDQS